MNPTLSKVIRNEHQLMKYQQLEDLASQVTSGVIVELGTYLGYGAIALCAGASVPVYTVDDYQNRKGWAGEVYYPKDREKLFRNCQLAKVYPVTLQYDARLLANDWGNFYPLVDESNLDVSLLVWDLGVPARLCEDFDAWSSHVTGKFVIHDTDDNRLGSDLLNPVGWDKHKDGVFWVLKKNE